MEINHTYQTGMEDQQYFVFDFVYPIFNWRNGKITISKATKEFHLEVSEDMVQSVIRKGCLRVLVARERVLCLLFLSLQRCSVLQRRSIRKRLRKQMQGPITVTVSDDEGVMYMKTTVSLDSGLRNQGVVKLLDAIEDSLFNFDSHGRQFLHEEVEALEAPDNVLGEKEINYQQWIVN